MRRSGVDSGVLGGLGCRIVGYWPKHPIKELEALLREFHALDWRIEKRSQYYWCLCPCGDHKKTVHLTPSTSRYELNVRQWLSRQECSKPEQSETTEEDKR